LSELGMPVSPLRTMPKEVLPRWALAVT
jgi:hypothetical protein